MGKRCFEKLSINTSLLGFGCMRFPTDAQGEIDEEEASKMIDVAYQAGVNYYDTAYPYHNGKSEPFMGKVMQKYPRNSFFFATKLPVWLVNDLGDVERIFLEQLERLQTEYVDFYLLHALSQKSWNHIQSLGVVERLEQYQREGKIRYLGFSFHDRYEAFEEILLYRNWDFCQIQLNYMDTEDQAGMKGYELAEARGIPLVIMEPIKGGSLARFSEDIEGILKQSNPQRSIASFALAWVGSLPNVKVILSGMSSLGQVQDNIDTFAPFLSLSQKEQDAILQAKEILLGRVQSGCTGCRYCMPCPMGVYIPSTFRLWNTYHIYQNYDMVSWEWEHEMTGNRHPLNCIDCGKCELACPQQLPIRRHLREAAKELDHEYENRKK